MKSIPVILMGCGGVGCQLLQHIISCRDIHKHHGLRLRVVGVADSKSLLSVPDIFTTELDDDSINEICRLKSNGSSLDSLTSLGDYQVFSNSETITNISEIASHLVRSTGLAVVDCSASADTIVILQKVLELGGCIVLANKKPLTSSMEDYDRLASHPRRLRHESTVGAGLPVIMSINRLLSSGDTIHRIVGSLSGTLGYVMSEVEDGKPLSQVVKTAKTLGYTEPDPRDDLGGMDVARKALIIARLLGQRIDLDSIKVESLYPAEMGPDAMSVEEFLDNGVSQVDSHLADRVEKAASKGHVLRYVCVIEGSRCEVGIQELPKNSALGRLRGSDNVLEVYSRCYSEQPLIIQGAGAGNDTTATGVLADTLDLQDLFT
ncbi:Bifunctional aspartokinase/homoserine dehydrogenase [Bienertia sinuspersici]